LSVPVVDGDSDAPYYSFVIKVQVQMTFKDDYLC
jgi:hypothetical protein